MCVFLVLRGRRGSKESGADAVLERGGVGEKGGLARRKLAEEAPVEGAEGGCAGGHCVGEEVRCERLWSGEIFWQDIYVHRQLPDYKDGS